MHGDLPRELEVMHPALEIVSGRAQVAQLLRFHHLIVFGGGLYLGFLGGNDTLVHLGQFRFARRDIKGKLIIELERLFIEHIQRLDVFQKRMFVLQKIIGDAVDLVLHLFETCGELRKWRGAAQQLFPKAPFPAHVQFGHRKTADRGHDVAQGIPGGADILVAHILQHALADLLQLSLRARTEGDDRLRIAEVDLLHPAADLGGLGGIRRVQRHDGVGVGGFGQPDGGDLVYHGGGLIGLVAHFVRHVQQFLGVGNDMGEGA